MEDKFLAQIKCGSDTFDIIQDEEYSRCYMNKTAVLRVKNVNIGTFGPIVGTLALSACGPSAKVKIKKDKSNTYNKFIGDIVKTVSDSNQAKIQVLESKPDEITENKPLEVSAASLETYRENLEGHCDCFDSILSLSNVLAKTKLPKSALIFKDIEGVMSQVKKALTDLYSRKETMEIAAEHTGTRVGQVIMAMDSNHIDCQGVKKSISNSVNHIATDFMNMKRLFASVLISHYPLYSVDHLFKKNTGYPATWFFDPSIFYNFTEQYKNASDNLIDMVREEASVVRPLYSWKFKVTEE